MHEISHAIVAKLAGSEIVAISLFPEETEQRLTLGYVEHRGADEMFLGLVGMAPLFMGSMIVTLLLRYGFSISWSLLLDNPGRLTSTIAKVAGLILSRRSPIMLYLLFAFGNGSMPSYSDWRYWGRTLAILTICCLAIGIVMSQVAPNTIYIERWLSILSMLIVEFTMICAMNVLIYSLLVFPAALIGHAV